LGKIKVLQMPPEEKIPDNFYIFLQIDFSYS
jgi:hypothetical protein